MFLYKTVPLTPTPIKNQTMKLQSGSKCSFSNPRLLIGLCFLLLSSFLALVGYGAISREHGNTRRSTTAATANVRRHSTEVPGTDNSKAYLDEKGNRPSG